MAGNPNYRRFTASEKVAFTTYNNIVLVDPNTVVDAEGNARERLVQHENLVMYANLQANILPRTKLAVGENFDEKSCKISKQMTRLLRHQGHRRENDGAIE